MATSQSNGNGQNSTPHNIKTPQPITIKLCTIDYVHETNSPLYFPTHSNKLWFHVFTKITLLSAKFSANLINIYKFTSCKTVFVVWPCTMHLHQSKRKWRQLTSFVYDVILHWLRRLHSWNGLSFTYFWRLGEIWPSKCGWPSFRHPKGTCLLYYECFEPSWVTSVGEYGEKKLKNWCHISRTWPDVPLRPIFTKCGLHVRLVDLINCAKFYRNRLRGLNSVKFDHSHSIAMSPLTQGRLPPPVIFIDTVMRSQSCFCRLGTRTFYCIVLVTLEIKSILVKRHKVVASKSSTTSKGWYASGRNYEILLTWHKLRLN